mmetsp:Transcript_19856/g.76081  ORF Transcript_19856/g.76081 Transcript_19856/m.76081 type:complete len:213 (-) Transcript_19856:1108-1746(-)
MVTMLRRQTVLHSFSWLASFCMTMKRWLPPMEMSSSLLSVWSFVLASRAKIMCCGIPARGMPRWRIPIGFPLPLPAPGPGPMPGLAIPGGPYMPGGRMGGPAGREAARCSSSLATAFSLASSTGGPGASPSKSSVPGDLSPACDLASPVCSVRPPNSKPSSWSVALFAAAAVRNSTKPKPLCRPLSWFGMSWHDVTSPKSLQRSPTSSAVMS